MWPWHVKMATQNLLKLLLLLKVMMRNVSTTVWCRFGRWTLVIKFSFCSDFEDKVSRFVQDFEVDVQARFWSWSLVIILLLMLGCGYEVHSWSRFWFGLVKIFKFKFCRNGHVWLRFWSWCKVKILKMFDQDLCGTCDMNSTLRSVVLLAMFFKIFLHSKSSFLQVYT